MMASAGPRMAKVKASLELPLRARSAGQPLTDWLYGELRSAILEGRLPPATRLPATRDLAALYDLSRGTVVDVFERLLSEGYLSSRVGAGTWVSDRVTPRRLFRSLPLRRPTFAGPSRPGSGRRLSKD